MIGFGETPPVRSSQKDSQTQTPQENTFVDHRPAELVAIKDAMRPLLRKLRPHIEREEYALLISDETSGRIPTLIVRKFINEIYKEKGLPPIDTLFYTGPKFFQKLDGAVTEEFEKRVKRVHQNHPDKKALIVTETIRGGWHIGFISEQLQDIGMNHDVGTLIMPNETKGDINYNRRETGYRPIAPHGEIFFGKQGNGIYFGPLEDEAIKGVRRDIEFIVQNGEHQDPINHGEIVIKDPAVRKTVVEARKKVDEISRELIDEIRMPWYKKIIGKIRPFGEVV